MGLALSGHMYYRKPFRKDLTINVTGPAYLMTALRCRYLALTKLYHFTLVGPARNQWTWNYDIYGTNILKWLFSLWFNSTDTCIQFCIINEEYWLCKKNLVCRSMDYCNLRNYLGIFLALCFLSREWSGENVAQL